MTITIRSFVGPDRSRRRGRLVTGAGPGRDLRQQRRVERFARRSSTPSPSATILARPPKVSQMRVADDHIAGLPTMAVMAVLVFFLGGARVRPGVRASAAARPPGRARGGPARRDGPLGVARTFGCVPCGLQMRVRVRCRGDGFGYEPCLPFLGERLETLARRRRRVVNPRGVASLSIRPSGAPLAQVLILRSRCGIAIDASGLDALALTD